MSLTRTSGVWMRKFSSSPIQREFSFHPVLGTYTVNQFLSKRQKKDPSMIATTVDAKQSISDAVRGMKGQNANRSALLVEKKSKVVGIITERDYARKVELLGKNPNITTCEEIMTPNPKAIPEDASLDDAIAELFKGSFRHLPVKDGETVKGMLGINDTLRELFRLQVLHKHMPAMKAPLTSIPNGPSKAKTHIVKDTDSVFNAIKVMSEKDVGSVVVENSANEMVGILTESDYVSKVAMPGTKAKDVKVAEVMTKNPVTTQANKSVLKGLELLIGQQCRHMPLLGEGSDGPLHKESGLRVVGMLSSKHIIRYVYNL